MRWIDTHCHLYSEAFEKDIDETIVRAKNAGVEKMFLPAIDSYTLQKMIALEQQYPAVCIAMMGLHPCHVNATCEQELETVYSWLQQRRFAAIGEIGLDYYWSTEFATQQAAAFNQQMQWALTFDVPVVIHTRNAMQPTIDAVKPFADAGLRGIFHCFSGNAGEAAQITAMNFYLGVGGVLTYKKSSLPEALQAIPLDKMVLETDAPYLPPVPHRGKRNESSYIPLIGERLAAVKGVTLEEVAAITTANAEKIFGC